jgi:acetyl-CoA carboxylase biotin carboxyl carrier protein
MSIDLQKLRALLDVLEERDIAEFEHEDEAVRLRVVRGARRSADGEAALSVGAPPAASHIPPTKVSVPPPESDLDAVDITSPFVGTFYRSPTPDAPPFVEIGSVVRQGQTLCIVEAMKLMNEIEAEHSGTVVEIFAQNGKSVEFGQRLFRIKKA